MIMKKLFIFDMGGVVSLNSNVFPSIFDYLDITEGEFMIFAGADLGKFVNGQISSKEFWTSFSCRYGSTVKEELFSKFFNPVLDPEMIDILIQLKENSRVVCGTNTIESHYNYHLKQGDYNVFDTVYASNIIGLSKPEPDFYRYILNKEGIVPESTVFVDDTPENIFSAREIGIKSILFTDASSLKEILNNCR